MMKILKIILCFVSTLEKHLQSNQYQDLFFEIHHISLRTKFAYYGSILNSVSLSNRDETDCISEQFRKKLDLD